MDSKRFKFIIAALTLCNTGACSRSLGSSKQNHRTTTRAGMELYATRRLYFLEHAR